MKHYLPVILLSAAALGGCGTTRWSDTQRTATEQLLISDAIDRAVSQLDFAVVAGKTVYLDTTPVRQSTDSAYLTSTLRQHLLAAGCIVKDKPDEADYVVEVRAGAVGTDRHDLLFGVPATKIPVAVPVPGVPTSIPEIPFATNTEQRAVAKIAVFAYNRRTGHPVWQSGVVPVESKVRDLWVLGAGPFQRGTIYRGTKFAGQKMQLPAVGRGTKGKEGKSDAVSVAQEAYFPEPETALAQQPGRPSPTRQENKKPAEVAQGALGAASTETSGPPADVKQAARAGAPSAVISAGHVEPALAPATDPTSASPPAPGPSEASRPKLPSLDFLDLPMHLGKGRTGGAE